MSSSDTPLAAEEMLLLARFRILDSRNSNEKGMMRLLGQMADEIERQNVRVASLEGQVAGYKQALDEAGRGSASADELNRRYDPMTPDELIAECERLRGQLSEAHRLLDEVQKRHALDPLPGRIYRLLSDKPSQCRCGAHKWPPGTISLKDSQGKMHHPDGCDVDVPATTTEKK